MDLPDDIAETSISFHQPVAGIPFCLFSCCYVNFFIRANNANGIVQMQALQLSITSSVIVRQWRNRGQSAM